MVIYLQIVTYGPLQDVYGLLQYWPSPGFMALCRTLVFRHDNVLRIIITNIRSSIKSFKSTVPTSKEPIKIKFVKRKGRTRVKHKQSPPSGILHQASDWVLLGDLDGIY